MIARIEASARAAGEYAALCRLLPALNVLNGCCGTDYRHVAAICRVCAPFGDTGESAAAHA